MQRLRGPRGKALRDWLIFTAGMLGIVYETVVEKADRPTLIILFASMVGLPAFLRGDELFGRKDDSDKGD